MPCIKINNVTFSSFGKNSIKQIKEIINLNSYAKGFVIFGNIFGSITDTRAISKTYSVVNIDTALLYQAI